MDILNMSKSKAGSSKAATVIPNKAAYVTYIGDGNEDETKGVVGLAKGLRKAQSKYPLVVAIPSNLYEKHRTLLESQGCRLEKIESISFPKADEHAFKPYYKLRLWEIKGYDRMIYLNADVQVYGNVDDLMDKLLEADSCLAVTGCLCGSKQPNTDSSRRCQKCPNTVTEPDDGGLPSPLYFNLGLVVFKPDPNTYNDLLKALKNRDTSTRPSSRPDNSAITRKYSVISLEDYLILDTPLPRHLTIYEPEKAKVVHYRSAELKPWKENKLEENGLQILKTNWQAIYNA